MCSPYAEQLQAANALRAAWAAGDRKRDADIPQRIDVVKLVDLSYKAAEHAEDAVWHLADIYYPKQHMGELYPVIVNVHGGGWFYGDKQTYTVYTQYLAAQGFAVVNFNYRLAPEHRYPAAISDVCAMMEYLADNAARLQLDLSRLYMVGDSAGAQLAAQYAILATNAEYRSLFPQTMGSAYPVPKKLALNCGVYEPQAQDETLLVWYMSEDIDAALADSLIRMTEYLTPQFPPAYVMASVNDGLLEASRALHQRLTDMQHPHIYREYGQENADSGHVFHLDLRNAEGTACNAEEIAFFTTE